MYNKLKNSVLLILGIFFLFSVYRVYSFGDNGGNYKIFLGIEAGFIWYIILRSIAGFACIIGAISNFLNERR